MSQSSIETMIGKQNAINVYFMFVITANWSVIKLNLFMIEASRLIAEINWNSSMNYVFATDIVRY